MATVSIPRKWIEDGSLPSVCVVCGDEANHRRYAKVAVPSFAWVMFSPLIGLATFWISVLFAGGASNEGGLPFCDRHRGYWTRRGLLVVAGFTIIIALIVVAVILSPPDVPGKKTEPHWIFGVLGCWLLLFLPAFLVLQLSATRPTGGDDRALKLSGAGRQFADALKEALSRAHPRHDSDRRRNDADG